MTNRSKARGTACETAVVRYLNAHGFPGAERPALHGALDVGDVTGCPGICFEIKGGAAAEQASDGQVAEWLIEAGYEAVNRGVTVAVLVRKRRGKGAASVGQWWAHMAGHTFVHLAAAGDVWEYQHLPPVQFTLADAVLLLRHSGYGNRPDKAAA